MLNRIHLYDNLKAIGMILVVLGHVTTNEFLQLSFSPLRMPLFFFISGMLYKPREQYIGRMARALLWPYLVFALLSFVYWALIEQHFRPIPENTSILQQFTAIFYPMWHGENSYLMNSPIWFLPALFICSCLYNYVLHPLSSKLKIYISLLIALIAYNEFFSRLELPLCVPQALAALPIYALGVSLNKTILNTINSGKLHLNYIASGLAVGLFAVLITLHPGGDLVSRSWTFGSYISYLILALLSIFALITLCPKRHISILNFIGVNSLAIMLLHDPVKRVIIQLYSWATAIEIDEARASAVHSILILIILLLVITPPVILIKKYCPKLLKI